MSHTPHELAEEFPQHAENMHGLRETDAHFARISDEYHTLNRRIHRAETDVDPTDDLHLTELRKQRMALKDEVYKILTTESAD